MHFEPDIEAKIRDPDHNLTPEQVRQAICWGAHETDNWDDDEIYGLRLVVTGTSADNVGLVAYLKPIDAEDGTWECRTAFRT